MKYGLKDQEIEIIKNAFQKFGAKVNDKILIFGSRAKGNFRYNSDIDLAYKGELNTEQKMKITDFLEEETVLPYKFDLVDYFSIKNKKLKEHIDRVGSFI